MGIDFDESGRNDEYGAEEGEPTGEPGDSGRPRGAAQPIVIAPTPQLHGNAQDLIRSIMGAPNPVTTPQTVEEALEVSQDTYMQEVEKRLEIAAYYRAALANPMFDNDTEAGRIVQHEFSGFIRERLGVLLSIGEPAKKETTFTESQVEILRLLGELTPSQVQALTMIASKVLGENPPATTLPPRKPPAAPAPRTAPAPRGPRPAPAAAPVLTQPQAAPTGEPPKPRGPGRPPGSKNKPKDGVEYVQAVRIHPDGTEEPLFKDDGSPLMKRVMPPRRPQRPAGALPMPTEAQIGQLSQIQAVEHAGKLEANPQVQKALKGLQNPV